MRDKRRLERFDLHVPARIQSLGSLSGNTLNLVTSDICSGGAFFMTEQTLPKGEEVLVDIVLSVRRNKKPDLKHDCAHIKLTGRVDRSGPLGMAIRFNSDYTIQSTSA
jgi:hypothetical protein